MQMSQVWADIGSAAHHTAAIARSVWRPEVFAGRNGLEESPRAAVALKGDVPISWEPMHCSGRVYRGLLCRNGVGLSRGVASAFMATMDHSKIGGRPGFLAILAALREILFWLEKPARRAGS